MRAEQVFYDDVAAGDVIPPLTVTVDEVQMFFFSAATYNGHRIHYDKDWARAVEGYDNVLVQGPLQAALLARAITDWIGGQGRLVAYSVQNRAIAFPGDVLTFGGVVTGKRLARRRDERCSEEQNASDERCSEEQNAGEQGLVDLDIAGRRGITVLMPGTATVALPRRRKAP
jgi:acyl dehydratase